MHSITNKQIKQTNIHNTYIYKYSDDEELVTVRNTVKKQRGMEVDDEMIRDVYDFLYMQSFLDQSIKSAAYCRNAYGKGQNFKDNAPNNLSCNDVFLFWQLHDLMKATSKSLRQQVCTWIHRD